MSRKTSFQTKPSQQTIDIPIKHLFVEYKFWIERKQPFSTVEEELATLARQGGHFRRIVEPRKGDLLYRLVTFLDAFDIRTSYPLLLTMLDVTMDDTEWKAISTTLESYLLRRAVCGLTTKNYNRVFLALTRNLRRDGVTHDNLVKQLVAQTGESVEWPTDMAFEEAWRTTHAYRTMSPAKIVHILKRLSDTYLGRKNETVLIEHALTVEHILPQDWIDDWPLSDGSKGMTNSELWSADENDPRAVETRRRNAAIQTLGNLTILTGSLNSAASNNAWIDKRPELLRHSLLPINQALLHDKELWDEAAISERSDALFDRAIEIWPRDESAEKAQSQ